MDLLRSIFKGDKVIWIIFLFLCLISIVEVFSAASTLTYKSGDHWGPITQHSIILMVGAVVVVFMHNIPYKWFQVFPVFLLPLSVVLLGLVMMMERINGAARWMTFMGIQFQPSEVAKMAVIIVTAFILSKGQDEDGASPKAFKRIMIITGVVCLLIAPENLSTAALLFGVVFHDVHRTGGNKETVDIGRCLNLYTGTPCVKRCRNGKSLFLVSTRNATPMIATPAKAPANINSFFIATRPMNIIRKTTPKSKAAVERFSGAISRQTTPVIIMIRLKAFGLAPSSSCPLERIKAVTMITAIFATSEGWNWIPMKVIQRAAPLMRSIIITRPSNTTDKGSRNTGNT